MKTTYSLLVALAVVACLSWALGPRSGAVDASTAASEAQPDDEPLALTFGVYRTDKATTMYRQFLPIVEALQGELSVVLKRPVDIELKIYKTYDEGLESLVTGTADFVRFGPASYILAKRQNPAVELLAMEHKNGKKRFDGVIVVRKNDRARTLADLKGRSFAFGDENSTIGRYLAQAELVRAGVRAGDLSRSEFLARHDAVAKAVQLGDFDAGSLKVSTFESMNEDGRLRVIHRFDNVTKPWVARAKLDPKVSEALTRVLLAFDDKESLQALGISGWLPAVDEDFAFVREGMLLAEAEFDKRTAQR